MIQHQFYIELGKLLYAIAKADGAIQDKEEKKLEKLIADEFIHHKTLFNQHPENKEIILTKLSFHESSKENLRFSEATDSFLRFMNKYGTKLNATQKKMALSFIIKIAGAYNGITEPEQILLQQLEKSLL